jgi:Fur family transcriptional regulator, ferric uptake regulator
VPSVEKEIERFASFLRKNGQKVTGQRTALVREIFGTHYHFDADELLRTLKEKNVETSRATVYRTLELLVRFGAVRRVQLGEDHYHYEWVGRGTHHDHLVCTTCGNVIEFRDELMDTRQAEICEKHGFVPTFRNVQILGVCSRCRRKGETPESPDRVQTIGEGSTRLRR